MQLQFGNVPTIASFDAKLKTFEKPVREEYRLKLCRLAFGYYDSLPGPFRKFTDAYLKHDRNLYVDYLTAHTPIGKLRFQLRYPKLFLIILYILETAGKKGRVKYHHQAACLLLAFSFPYKLETLDNYLCHSQPDTNDLCEFLFLLGKIEIGDE